MKTNAENRHDIVSNDKLHTNKLPFTCKRENIVFKTVP